MADIIEEAAKALGIDAADLRKIQAEKQRDEVKGIVREVLEDFFGDGDDGDGDGDGDGDDDSLRGQVRKAAAGKKTKAPKKAPAAKDDDDDDPPVTPPSLAKRFGLAS